MKRTMMSAVVAVLLAATAGVALAQEARAPSEVPPKLTAEQEAALRQAQDLQKQIEISRLELRLAELKDASQEEIAEKATRMYRLRGELHALRVKNPVVARYQWREQGQRRWGRGARGGPGPAWGRGLPGRHGRHGMRRGGGPGRGAWGGGGAGIGRGRAMDRGPGPRMGPPGIGMGQAEGLGVRGRRLGGGRDMGHTTDLDMGWVPGTWLRHYERETLGLAPGVPDAGVEADQDVKG